MNFWDFIGLLFWTYVLFAYLMILFSIVADIFRDKELGGFMKAVWIFFLIFVPFLTALVYVLARGNSMTDRQLAAAQQSRAESDSYIRSVAAAPSATDEIVKAKALLDSGSITQTEFDGLKARALAAV